MGGIHYRVSGGKHEHDYPRQVIPLDLLGCVRAEETRIAVREALREASRKESMKVVYLYFYEELTLQEIGDLYGTTRERVRQVLDGKLARLRRIMRDSC